MFLVVKSTDKLCNFSDSECVGASGEPLSTAPFEKPGDCDNFYQCGAGELKFVQKSTKMQCKLKKRRKS